MNNEVTEAEARLALNSIEQRRQQVIAEIDVPPWYWISVAGGWVVLGVLADYGPAWAITVGTVAFGAVHSAVAPRILSGRHASQHVSVRSDLVSRRLPVFVIGFLILMTVVTVALASHRQRRWRPARSPSRQCRRGGTRPLGGPRLMDTVRRRAERRIGAS